MAGASLVFILLSGNLPFLAGLLPGLLMAALMMLTVTYFAHKNKWGADIKFFGSRLAKALAELAVVAAWPLLLWGLIRVSAPPHITVIAGLVEPFALDKIFKFEAVLPIMTPVLLIGRHDDRPVHPHRGRHCRLRLGHGAGPWLVPHAKWMASRSMARPGRKWLLRA